MSEPSQPNPPAHQPGYQPPSAPPPGPANPWGAYADQAPPTGYQQPYGQVPPPGAPQPYGQYPPAPYGQPPAPGYGQHPGQYPPAPYGQAPYAPLPTGPQPDQPGSLGTIALVVVGVCAIVVTATGWVVGNSMGGLLQQIYPTTPGDLDQTDPRVYAWAQALAPWFNAGMLATLAGMAGWVTALVAFRKRVARRHALIAIIVGVLAPVISFVAFVVGVWPAVAALT